MQVLLHICCGPCALYPLTTLRSAGHQVSGFFYNPNIHPYQEYVRRRDAAVKMTELEKMPMIMQDNYDLEDFLCAVSADPKNRCTFCYATRLNATAQTAKQEGFEAFTASLLYSRYQKHDEIRSLGENIAKKHGVHFLYEDFRPGWQAGIKQSKELGLYRQQYCGCIYSEKERYSGKTINQNP